MFVSLLILLLLILLSSSSPSSFNYYLWYYFCLFFRWCYLSNQCNDVCVCFALKCRYRYGKVIPFLYYIRVRLITTSNKHGGAFVLAQVYRRMFLFLTKATIFDTCQYTPWHYRHRQLRVPSTTIVYCLSSVTFLRQWSFMIPSYHWLLYYRLRPLSIPSSFITSVPFLTCTVGRH